MRLKKVISVITAIILLCCCTLNVLATSSSEIKKKQDELQEEVDKNKENLEDVKGNLEDLEGEYDGLTDEMDALSAQIVDIMTSISILNEEITAKEEEIAQTQLELEAAIEKENEQYAAMKIRVKFMYESGQSSYLSYILESGSMADMLTRVEYIDKIYVSDRTMLDEYVATKEAVALMKEELEIEESELQTSKEECEAEQKDLEAAMGELQLVAKDYEAKISSAKKQAADYAAKIKKQNAEIKKLEAQRKAAMERENPTSNNSGSKKSGSDYTVDTNIITSANGSDIGKQIALYAVKFLGNPYKAGGTSLTQGTDCSGFTSSVYSYFGYSIPRNSYGQRSAGTEVAYANAQPGDIICYAGHVALYIGGGKIVHASSAKTGIKISNATYKSIITVRRIV